MTKRDPQKADFLYMKFFSACMPCKFHILKGVIWDCFLIRFDGGADQTSILYATTTKIIDSSVKLYHSYQGACSPLKVHSRNKSFVLRLTFQRFTFQTQALLTESFSRGTACHKIFVDDLRPGELFQSGLV